MVDHRLSASAMGEQEADVRRVPIWHIAADTEASYRRDAVQGMPRPKGFDPKPSNALGAPQFHMTPRASITREANLSKTRGAY